LLLWNFFFSLPLFLFTSKEARLLMKAEMADKNNRNKISILLPTRWCSLHPWEVQFCFISGVWILDVPKYVRAYPSSFHQFLLWLLFMSNSQLCSHQVPNVFTLYPHDLCPNIELSYHICVCVCEPKEALLLHNILSANFYFGGCQKFQYFLLWPANQNSSLGTIFFNFKKRKIYKEPLVCTSQLFNGNHNKYPWQILNIYLTLN
jgi:hypothetical protein